MGSKQDFQAIKAPYTIHEEAVASVRTNFNHAFLCLPLPSSFSDISRLQDDIFRYGSKLKDLEYQYKEALCNKEVAYEEQRPIRTVAKSYVGFRGYRIPEEQQCGCLENSLRRALIWITGGHARNPAGAT